MDAKTKAAGLRTQAAFNSYYRSNHSSPLELVLARLPKVSKSGGGWLALCPAHDDRLPSLSIKQGDGKVLLWCHAGCKFDAIVVALGLEPHQLFDNGSPPR